MRFEDRRLLTLSMMRGIAISALMCFVVVFAAAQPKSGRKTAFDSIQHVGEVVITQNLTYREVIPSHTMKGKELERLNAHNIADALRYFAGLQLKDYGGVGGIKTVNIRSMGSNHVGIFYDGIQLGNAQNGQVDLGQFSMDNVDEITLYNGQKSAIFQPASEFGNAGSVYIKTRRPKFTEGRDWNLKVKTKYASSDHFRLSTLWEQRLSRMVSSSVNAEFISSSGKYDFRYRRLNQDGTVAYDTTATRHNGDVWAMRAEANVYGLIDDGGWNLKAYTYHSERGIPGAIVNNVWRRGERQADHNTFLQAYLNKSVGQRFSTRLLAKYAYYNTHYVNRDTTTLRVDNTYRQQEFFVSSSNVYEILPCWSASLAYDLKWNKLDADMRAFVSPHRVGHYASVATAYNHPWFNIQGSLMAQFIGDTRHERTATVHISQRALTPAVFVNAYPLRSKLLSLRAFAKKSYRMPTFNDLYYTDLGNASLQPESALQYNVGFVVEKDWTNGLLRHVRWQADAYYNTVHDKIVAYPKGQQFRWTMLNLGKVHIKGIDVEGELAIAPMEGLQLSGRVQYTYQDARDVTDPSTSYYRDQIPYIPWHSGSAILGISYHDWDLNYSFLYAGERYNQQENIVYNYMQPWYTSDLSLSRQFQIGRNRLKVLVEVNNLFSQDYDVILNYPMPKRNYGVTVEWDI